MTPGNSLTVKEGVDISLISTAATRDHASIYLFTIRYSLFTIH